MMKYRSVRDESLHSRSSVDLICSVVARLAKQYNFSFLFKLVARLGIHT
jgi:hypothetical protein